MAARSNSPVQRRLFTKVVERLAKIGYNDDLLHKAYTFEDIFADDNPERRVDAAAFGQTPTGYDSACIAVVIGNGKTGPDLIRDYRALGAPLAIEVRESGVELWRVGADPSPQDRLGVIAPDHIDAALQEHEASWKPGRIFRAKNVGAVEAPSTDFIDLGLIPALEQHVRAKLDFLLRSTLHAAQTDFRRRHRRNPDWGLLCRLLFRLVYAKVMCDRGELHESACVGPPDAATLLTAVAVTYGDHTPILDDPPTWTIVTDSLWRGVSFKEPLRRSAGLHLGEHAG